LKVEATRLDLGTNHAGVRRWMGELRENAEAGWRLDACNSVGGFDMPTATQKGGQLRVFGAGDGEGVGVGGTISAGS